MPDDEPTAPRQRSVDDLAAERNLLVRVGAAMTIAGDSIDEVGTRLNEIARARGVTGLSVVVLPTAVFVQTTHGEDMHVQLEAYPNERARFDQISDLYALLERAEQPSLDAHRAAAEIDGILRAPPTVGAVTRTLGLGVLSVGFSLSLQPTVPAMAAAFVLGILVGLLRLIRWPGIQAALPVIATFVVASIVFATTDSVDTGNPVRTLIPPIVTFLPGAVLTSGMRDLAAGQIISGASRLVHGLVTLALLSFGIVAAATLVGTPASELLDRPPDRLGSWAPWIGLVLIAIGTHLHHCAPRRSVPWILLVLVAAYGGQATGAAVFSPRLSPFFGGLALVAAVLALERLRIGPPALIVFLPGFWVLVPGAAGLISATEIASLGASVRASELLESLGAVVAIALGVLIGTTLFRASQAGIDEAVQKIPPRWSRAVQLLERRRRRESSTPDETGPSAQEEDRTLRGRPEAGRPTTDRETT